MAQIEDKALSEVTQRLHNEVTKKAYLYQLRCYLNWTEKESYDELIKQTNEDIQKNLEDYARYLQLERHSKSFYNLIFSALTFFYEINFKLVNRTRIRTMIEPNEDKIGGIAYSTDDIKKILDAVEKTKKPKYKIKTKLRSKTMIHILASSGIRIGALSDLRVRDLEKIQNCYSIKVYAGTRFEHFTFLTPEASFYFEKYIKEKELTFKKYIEVDYWKNERVITFPESFVFNQSLASIRLTLNRIVRKAKLQENKQGKRYEKPLAHAFRKRFNTIMKSNAEVNPTLAELMLGHTLIKLDVHYLKVEKENLFFEFSKVIDTLTINPHFAK